MRPHEYLFFQAHIWPCRKVACFPKFPTTPDHAPFYSTLAAQNTKFINMSKMMTIIVAIDSIGIFLVYRPALLLHTFSVTFTILKLKQLNNYMSSTIF